MKCQDRSGFLFAHDCELPATVTCSACAKSICWQHTRESTGGPTCIGCWRADPTAKSEEDDAARPAYDADDAQAFEEPDAGAEADDDAHSDIDDPDAS